MEQRNQYNYVSVISSSVTNIYYTISNYTVYILWNYKMTSVTHQFYYSI